MKVIRCNYGELGINSYIAIDEQAKACVLVDPSGDYHRYIKDLDELDITPVALLITHGHFDHVSAVDGLKDHYKIPVYAHKVEAEFMEDAHKNLSYHFYQSSITAHADTYIDDGDSINLLGELSFESIMVPGHSENSICFYNKEHGILFTGDTLMNMGMGRTDLYSKSPNDLVKNINEKLMVLDGETTVYPGHGDKTTIGYEKKYNYMINNRY